MDGYIDEEVSVCFTYVVGVPSSRKVIRHQGTLARLFHDSSWQFVADEDNNSIFVPCSDKFTPI